MKQRSFSRWMRFTITITITFTIMVIVACPSPNGGGGSGDDVVLRSLTASVTSITDLQISESVSFFVSAEYSDGSSRRVTTKCQFSVDDDTVASISASGAVTALAEGSTSITVTYQGQTLRIPVTTIEQYASLTASVTAINAPIGDTVPVVFTLEYADGRTRVVTQSDGLEFSGVDAVALYDGAFRIFDGGSGDLVATFSSQRVSIPVNVQEFNFGTRRTISEQDWERRAISYSGYRAGQSPDLAIYPSESEIKEDLLLLQEAGFTFLRLYDTGTHARRTLEVIKTTAELSDFIVQLGVWISGPQQTNGDENWIQIDGAEELLKLYPSIIVSVSVGNETMVDWNDWWPTPPEDIRRYIQYLRTRISVPITTDDNWEPFARYDTYVNADTGQPYETLGVAQVIDYLAIHTYPIADAPWGVWDEMIGVSWKRLDVAADERAVAMMDSALDLAQFQYQEVRANMDVEGLSGLPIIIGETGWKHTPTDRETYRAHPVNARMFYDRMTEWVYGSGRTPTGPRTVMYFEAFDEPWKSGDDGWGLFNVDRKPYYALYSQSDSDSFVAPDGESYTETDAIYHPD